MPCFGPGAIDGSPGSGERQDVRHSTERTSSGSRRWGLIRQGSRSRVQERLKETRKSLETEIEDTEAYFNDAITRLEEVWETFQAMSVKQVVNDEGVFRELKDRFGSPFGWGEYFRGGMGAESVRELLEQVDLEAECEELEQTINTSKGQKRPEP